MSYDYKYKLVDWKPTRSTISDLVFGARTLNFETPLPVADCITRLEQFENFYTTVAVSPFSLAEPEAGCDFQILASYKNERVAIDGTLHRDQAYSRTKVHVQLQNDRLGSVLKLLGLGVAVVCIPVSFALEPRLSGTICIGSVILIAISLFAILFPHGRWPRKIQRALIP